ncbi:aldo/keto reductase [Treponema primitia ZAS-2]|uniref:Aldo/keto reductase n=1 Tax=Treponema primitia (strain ATCC BAA-887 / DSM 12427 / ZAS-2) TaxID=545694 RepID=F5YJ10_TREPZ|nr:aldo/keto reductase [Treponema primitia]AEF85639.1 aldo/keto reductase [Treponema primitia ZAS-2]
MQYREDKVSGNKLSILGLGCMRFSRNMAETERMILAAIDGGVNYFDTAYIYPNSEETLGTILGKHKKRTSVFIATKLPLIVCKGPDDFDKFFNKELERLQTDYIDYYLMHMITDSAQWEQFREWGIEQWIAEKKRAGKIRQAGFSFHGSSVEFLKILNAYPWDFCQIQYNYSNENYQAGKEGLKAAAAKGIPVMIMEPLLGGKLAAGLPKEAAALFSKTDPTLSPAAWGFRWLWNQSEVSCVLSGMNTTAQMEDNLRSAENARPLTDAELAVYTEVIGLFNRAYKIHCTGCNYCMPCPKGINIPGCFAAYNASFAQNFTIGMQQFLTSTAAVSKKPHSPRLCVECGKCESHCPQHLPIRKALKQVARRMEPLPVRLGLSIARQFLG